MSALLSAPAHCIPNAHQLRYFRLHLLRLWWNLPSRQHFSRLNLSLKKSSIQQFVDSYPHLAFMSSHNSLHIMGTHKSMPKIKKQRNLFSVTNCAIAITIWAPYSTRSCFEISSVSYIKIIFLSQKSISIPSISLLVDLFGIHVFMLTKKCRINIFKFSEQFT